MSVNYRLSLRLLASAAGLALLSATGCVKDRDYEDFRRDKLAEDLSELAPAAGTYRGSLTSKQSGLALGALEITLTPQVKTIPGMSGDKADGAPVLSVQITFQDAETRFALTALDSYFDRISGRLEVTLPISRANGRSEQLVLSGFVADKGLGGQLQITGASELAASFHLEKNTSESISEIAQKLVGQKSRDPNSISASWKGTTKFHSGVERPVSVVFIEPNTSPEELFLNRFAPIQVVQFTLNYDDSVKLVHEGALWDRRTGKLTGKARIARGTQVSEIVTECESVQETWNCMHQSQGLGSIATTQVMLEHDPGTGDRGGEAPSDLRAVQTVTRTGKTRLDSGEVTAWLKATFAARTREQEFWDLFVPTPERTLTVSLQFGVPGQPEAERLVVLFDQALLDLRSHTLDGRVVLRQGLGSSFIEVTLHCENFRFPGLEAVDGRPSSISCQYWSSHRPQKLSVTFP
jgi:hypothetical protein